MLQKAITERIRLDNFIISVFLFIVFLLLPETFRTLVSGRPVKAVRPINITVDADSGCVLFDYYILGYDSPFENLEFCRNVVVLLLTRDKNELLIRIEYRIAEFGDLGESQFIDVVTDGTISDSVNCLIVFDRHLIVAHAVLVAYKLVLGNIETGLAIENILDGLCPVCGLDCSVVSILECCVGSRSCDTSDFDFD